MILAIDIGNTNIVLGCMEHDRILVEARMATDLLKTSDQYCVELKNLLNLYEIDPKSVEGVIISSVVPPVLNSCKTAVRKLTGKTPMIVETLCRVALYTHGAAACHQSGKPEKGHWQKHRRCHAQRRDARLRLYG